MRLVKAAMKLLGFAHPQAWATWVVSWPSLVEEFDRTPRAGRTVYGFVVGIYPTDHPTLPEE